MNMVEDNFDVNVYYDVKRFPGTKSSVSKGPPH